MFKNWFRKSSFVATEPPATTDIEIEDEMEESLWQIKEEYDLPTEEIINVVQSKRESIEHMHRMLSKKQKYE